MLQEVGRQAARWCIHRGLAGSAAGFALLLAGCGSEEASTPAPTPELTASAEERKEPLPVAPAAPPEPFDTPPLAALDEEAGWIDRPVRDGLALLREDRADEPPLAGDDDEDAAEPGPAVSEDLGEFTDDEDVEDDYESYDSEEDEVGGECGLAYSCRAFITTVAKNFEAPRVKMMPPSGYTPLGELGKSTRKAMGCGDESNIPAWVPLPRP